MTFVKHASVIFRRVEKLWIAESNFVVAGSFGVDANSIAYVIWARSPWSNDCKPPFVRCKWKKKSFSLVVKCTHNDKSDEMMK